MRFWKFLVPLLALSLAACQAQAALPSTSTATVSPTITLAATPVPTSTPVLTATPSPSPTATLFPLSTSSGTIVACSERRPAADDLLPIVTASFGLARDYVPGDLVSLGNYVSWRVTLPELQLRKEAAGTLGKMVAAMQAVNLAPTVLSAYRSYYDQVGTYQMWTQEDPAMGAQVSARPGHSEHQLGTVVDFGSPELPALVGDPTVKFHPLFSQTSEGRWLAEHAHEYGFTLTNPPGAQFWTGLVYEPWHYRFVGVDLATYLHASGYSLVEFLFKRRPELPCIPELTNP